MIDKLKEKSVIFNSALKVWKDHKVCAIIVLGLIAVLIIR